MRLINKTKKSIMINNFSSRKYFKKEFQLMYPLAKILNHLHYSVNFKFQIQIKKKEKKKIK